MPIDYGKLVDVAARLIGENGRTVTLVRRSSSPADPARPWGPAAAATATVSVTAVFLEPEERQTTSGDIQPTAQLDEFRRVKVLVAAEGAPTDLGPEWYILDGTQRLEIVIAKPIRPGGTLIYYDVEARL